MRSFKRFGRNFLAVIGGIILANIIVQLFNFFTGKDFAPNNCNFVLLISFITYLLSEIEMIILLSLPDNEKFMEISKMLYHKEHKKISDIIEIMEPHEAAWLLYQLTSRYNLSGVIVTEILSLCPKDLGKSIAQKIEQLQDCQR